MALTKKRLYIWTKYVRPYILKKECLETTETEDYGRCCTCGRVFEAYDLDIGHFIPGHKDAYLFEEMGIHIQCRHCNRVPKKYSGDAGKPHEYYRYMIDRYGYEKTMNFVKKKWESVKLTDLDLEEIKKYYKKKLSEL